MTDQEIKALVERLKRDPEVMKVLQAEFKPQPPVVAVRHEVRSPLKTAFDVEIGAILAQNAAIGVVLVILFLIGCIVYALTHIGANMPTP